MVTKQKLSSKIIAPVLSFALVFGMMPGLSVSAAGIIPIMPLASGGSTIDMSDPSPPTSGTGWTYSGGTDGSYTILDGANVTVTGSNSGSQRRIWVDMNATANVKLQNTNIDMTGTSLGAFTIFPSATVNLTLSGNNKLYSSDTYAGLQVPSSAKLTIDGDGSLSAVSLGLGAGIGGGWVDMNGVITIESGTITALGGIGSAGIGAGSSAPALATIHPITINGGNITAIAGGGSNEQQAAIGRSDTAPGEEVYIYGNYNYWASTLYIKPLYDNPPDDVIGSIEFVYDNIYKYIELVDMTSSPPSSPPFVSESVGEAQDENLTGASIPIGPEVRKPAGDYCMSPQTPDLWRIVNDNIIKETGINISTGKVNHFVNIGPEIIVPNFVLNSLKLKEPVITLMMYTCSGVSFSITSKNIPNRYNEAITAVGPEAGNIDLSINRTGMKAPVNVIAEVLKDTVTNRLVPMASRERFGMVVNQHYNVGPANAGNFANLYRYNDRTGQFDYLSSYQINEKGQAMFATTIAADYLLTVTTAKPTLTAASPDPAIVIPGSHIVMSGDTLLQIAKRYGVSLSQIKVLNPDISNIDRIKPGQIIRLR